VEEVKSDRKEAVSELLLNPRALQQDAILRDFETLR